VDEPQVAVYVYGVQRASEAKPLDAPAPGVEGSGVAAVEHAGLAALTGPLRGTELGARDLRAHWRVLEDAFARATVLPLRFGTVMQSEQAVRELLLEPNAERLNQMLDELDGTAQFGVKGQYDEERLLREVVEQSPAVAGLRERTRNIPDDATSHAERVRLGQLVADEIGRRRELDTRLALDGLEPLAVAARDEEPRHPHTAFNLTFLVNDAKRSKFDAAVGRLQADLGERMEIHYVGPLPPYSFADADLSLGSAAWA
jgi:hypothetical protein